jgi:hypothetical protein
MSGKSDSPFPPEEGAQLAAAYKRLQASFEELVELGYGMNQKLANRLKESGHLSPDLAEVATAPCAVLDGLKDNIIREASARLTAAVEAKREKVCVHHATKRAHENAQRAQRPQQASRRRGRAPKEEQRLYFRQAAPEGVN